MQRLNIFNKLLGGQYALSMKEILDYNGSVPLLSALDYYQSSEKEKNQKPTQVLLRAGSDLKKKEKYLQKIMGVEDGKNSDGRFICEASGKKISSFLLEVSPHTSSFFKEKNKKSISDMLSVLSKGDIASYLIAEAQDAMPQIIKELHAILEEDIIAFYAFDLQESDKGELFRLGGLALYSMLLGTFMGIKSDEIRHLGRSALLYNISGYDYIFDPSVDAKDAAKSETKALGDLLGTLSIPEESLSMVRKQFSNTLDKKEPNLAVACLQTLIAFDCYRNGGTYIIGNKRDGANAGVNLSDAMHKLIIKSNPKINDSCPEPLLDERCVNMIAKILDHGFLIEKERRIRTEILKKCEYTNCLTNRVSVVCQNQNFSAFFQDKHTFCAGQGSTTQIFTGDQGKGTHIPKCNKGCETLSMINHDFRRVAG